MSTIVYRISALLGAIFDRTEQTNVKFHRLPGSSIQTSNPVFLETVASTPGCPQQTFIV